MRLNKSLSSIKETFRENIQMFPNFLPKENDNGDTEYKLKLINITKDKKFKLETQMQYRISQGNGISYYIIGVNDLGKLIGITSNEFIETWQNLYDSSKNLGYECKLYSIKKIDKLYLAKFIISNSTFFLKKDITDFCITI
jgi:GTPase